MSEGSPSSASVVRTTVDAQSGGLLTGDSPDGLPTGSSGVPVAPAQNKLKENVPTPGASPAAGPARAVAQPALSDEDGPRSVVVLTRREQSALAVILLVLLVSAGAVWWQRGGSTQVEYERRLRQPLPFQIDINTCDWPELAQVSGIGETLARRIIDHREERGGFRDAQEILDVKGIGPKKLAELQPYLAPIHHDPAASALSAPGP